jgi:DNA modification methylase
MTDTAPAPDISLIPQRYEALVPFDQLIPHPKNPNETDLDDLGEVLRVNGFGGAILAQEGTRIIIDGEQRRATAMAGGLTAGPVIWMSVTDEDRDRLLAEWNESGRRGINDMAKLVDLLQGLEATPQGLAGSAFNGDQLAAMVAALGGDGLGEDGGGDGDGARPSSLADRFLVPPFSVLDARQGYWQTRKRAWLGLGIRSELGRPRNLLKMSDTVLGAVQPARHTAPTGGHMDQQSASQPRTPLLGAYGRPNKSQPGARPVRDPQFTAKHRAAEAEAGRPLTTAEFLDGYYEPPERAGNLDGAERRGQVNMSRPRSVHGADIHYYDKKRAVEEQIGRTLTNEEFQADHYDPRPRGQASGHPNGSVPGSDSGNDPTFYYKKRLAEREAGRELTTEEFTRDWYDGPDVYTNGTSVFDPVLAELACRWWCPPAGRVLDPFAGGSVRGIVASRLDLEYTGIDLSEAQVEANNEQAAVIGPGGLGVTPTWLCGDARAIGPAWPAEGCLFDLLFTCPPYFDLEQYSDDPDDLSNAGSYAEFMTSFGSVLAACAGRLADNRFAVLVVGEIRDTHGIYRGLVPDTIRAAEAAGLTFYNEAILITSVGSLALRAARIFSGGRKLGKAHQNVLVFVKGDPRKAAEACGVLDIPDPAELFGQLGFDTDAGAEGDAAASAEEPQAGAQLELHHDDGEGGAASPEPAAERAQVAERPAEPAPAWAKGLPMTRLRETARLWQAHDGNLPMGAFMGVKENQVADWASGGKLRAWGRDGVLAAAAVVTEATGQGVTDFRGETIARPPRGATVVQRFAGDPAILAAELGPRLADRSLWLWAWMENPADRWLATHLGLYWQGTKIRASSELIGLFGPDDPGLGAACPGIDIHGLVRFDLDYDPLPLLEEVAAAEPGWADHYAVYNKRGTWQAVALRGYGGDPGFIIKPAEMSRKWKAEHPKEMGWKLKDSPLYDTLPGIRALVSRLPGKKHRVRLMRLAPGNGELTRHSDITDPDAGTKPGQLLRIHLPLVTNPLVVFRSWTPDGARQTAHMAAGETWYLDTRKPHTARNDGAAERIHVVADVESTPALLALTGRAAPAEGPDLDYTPPRLGDWQPWPLTS